MEQSVRRALAFLSVTQVPDGSFTGYTSPSQYPFIAANRYATTFTPAQILQALACIPQAMDIRQPLATWLLAQRSNAWTFNYWAQAAPQRSSLPYPDDLDDTFCSITALYRHDPSLISMGSLGEIVHILIAAETAVGGPYRTWLVDSDAPAVWQDVDLAVNANIAYFLRTAAQPLPSLTTFMDQAIANRTFMSPYYPGPLPVLYCMARAYTGAQGLQLIAAVQSFTPQNALEQALWCSALMYLGEYPAAQPVLEALRATQATDGSWPSGAFCLDPAQNGTAYYQGAAALTTACAAEALHMYLRRPANATVTATAARPPEYQLIITAAKATFDTARPALRGQCHSLIDTMTRGDASQEIVMLPQICAASLVSPPTPSLPALSQPTLNPEALTQLSLANLYGWMAYTVYDDFLDGDGKPVFLPAASAALRASVAAFAAALPHDPGFQTLVQHTFTAIDNANTWEVQNCRSSATPEHITLPVLPRFGTLAQLAERSSGHALTPVGVLLLAGYRLSSSEVRLLRASLHHYLIARQLQDDLHDWKEDIQTGQLTVVVTAILRQLRVRPGRYSYASLLPRMEQAFWQQVLPRMCRRCLHHITRARTLAEQSSVLAQDSPFYRLYDRLEDATHQTLAAQADALEFLAGYKKPPA